MDIDPLTNFKKRYEADIKESRTRYAVYHRPNYNDWNSTASAYIEHNYKQAVDVTLTQEHFHKLVEREYHFTELERNHNFAQELIDRQREEHRIRLDNPAVQKAYEKYQMLLELVRK